MVTHARNRGDLTTILKDDITRVLFIEDSWLHRSCYRTARFLPPRISSFTVELLSRVATQIQAKRMARELIAQGLVDVIHQPAPVSPKEISFIHGLGVPVVIGPLNGNMEFPPAFRARENKLALAFTRMARPLSHLLNWLVPGKRKAAVLLVSNERTRQALPRGCRGRVIEMVENGVELDIWQPKTEYSQGEEPVRFIYLGRLVDWKAVDLLIKAFARVAAQIDSAVLEIVGDGATRSQLEQLAASLNIQSRVEFVGWKPQSEASKRLRDSDVFALPSLYECGGAVVIEAMASGLPVIATNWGGPADYVDASCGILVDPKSEEAFIAGLADAMMRLARSPELRRQMGQAGRERAQTLFSWDAKIDALLEIFRTLCPDSSETQFATGATVENLTQRR
jgi:glycosyltransferase involved in cell wall biosynthesis